jgi:uncharacterized protein (TIGR03437 family)
MKLSAISFQLSACSVLLLAAALRAQTFAPLRVSPAGQIVDNTNKPVVLRGLNRSATASGNADAAATDAQYAAQNQLLSMNVVRIFVNATWWTSNVQVPIAGQNYQTYIDTLIQRVKKYNNYALILKATQFPEPPCGANGQNCPATNQGDLDCQANPSLCAAEDTTGNTIDGAIAFWDAFSTKYASDPAVLYDTWENMHGISNSAWSDDHNTLIATIRANSPQSLIFVEDTGTAFESIVSGALADIPYANLVWNFQLYAGPTATCGEPAASLRLANWPQNFAPLVAYAQQNGHAAAITEWGGCNDSQPYHANIVTFAETHSVPLVFFDSSDLFTPSGSSVALTAAGTQTAQSYSALAAGGPGLVTSVSATDGAAALAPEAIASAYGANLAGVTQQAGAIPLPVILGGTSVVVTDANGIARTAELFYVSPLQVNFEVPPGMANGKASITVSLNGDPVALGSATLTAVAPGIFSADGSGQGTAAGIIYTLHADGTSSQAPTTQSIDLSVATDQVTLELFGTGIRAHANPVTCKIGTTNLPVAYAGPQDVYVGLDQVNIPLPQSLRGSGTQSVTLTVDGQFSNTVTVNFK